MKVTKYEYRVVQKLENLEYSKQDAVRLFETVCTSMENYKNHLEWIVAEGYQQEKALRRDLSNKNFA